MTIQDVYDEMVRAKSGQERADHDKYWPVFVEKYWPTIGSYRGGSVDDIPLPVFGYFLRYADVALHENSEIHQQVKAVVEARKRFAVTAQNWTSREQAINELDETLNRLLGMIPSLEGKSEIVYADCVLAALRVLP